jgi:hypothetical protein
MKLVNYKNWPKVGRFDKNSIYVQEAIYYFKLLEDFTKPPFIPGMTLFTISKTKILKLNTWNN